MLKFVRALKSRNILRGCALLSVSAAFLFSTAASATTMPLSTTVSFTGNLAGGYDGIDKLLDGDVRGYDDFTGTLATGQLADLDFSTLVVGLGGSFVSNGLDPATATRLSTPVTNADGSKTLWATIVDGGYTKALKLTFYDDSLQQRVRYHVDAAAYTSNTADWGKDFDTITHTNQTIARNNTFDGYGLKSLRVTRQDGTTAAVDNAFAATSTGNTTGNNVVMSTLSADNVFQFHLETPADIGRVTLWQATDCCRILLATYLVEIYNGTNLLQTLTINQSDFSSISDHKSFATVNFAELGATHVRVRSAGDLERMALTEVQIFAASAPGALGLLGLGLAGAAAAARRRRRKA